MIIVHLIGGLGNQMFQYAAGKSLAEKNKTPLKLDVTYYKDDPLRNYELHCFSFAPSFASIRDIKIFRTLYSSPFTYLPPSFHKMLVKLTGKRKIKESHFHFDKTFFSNRGDVYLEGYWASEKYFIDIADKVRNDFTFSLKSNVRNQKYYKLIKNSNAISLHVRRGDYVSNPTTNQYHGVCTLQYYQEAIMFITQKITNPTFFIFSDDPKWVKENLHSNHPVIFVEGNNDSPGEDLKLMSSCCHHIIANSTFSWWGAWLNPQKDKIVITPKTWFADITINTNDLIPKEWIRL